MEIKNCPISDKMFNTGKYYRALLDSSSASISAGNPSDPGGNSYYRYTIDTFGRLEEMRVEQIVVGLKIRRLLTYTYY